MTDENLAPVIDDEPQELPPETIGEEPAVEAPPANDEPPKDEDEPGFEPLSTAQQKVVDKGFDKRTKSHYDKLRAEQLARETAEKRLADLTAAIPKPQRPVVPNVPDEFDDDFQAKIQARDQALLAQAQFDARSAADERQAQAQVQEKEQKYIETVQKDAASYAERAKTAKVDPGELQQAGNTVASYQLPDRVVERILRDPIGPEITLHLAKNPNQLAELRGMNEVDAAVYLATTVTTDALAGRAGTGSAPPPTPHHRGAGFQEKQRGPKGATFT